MVLGTGRSPRSESADGDAATETLSGTGSGGWLDAITGGNQFMSAGLGVMAVGAGLAVARSSVKRAAGFAKHQMLGRISCRMVSYNSDVRE